ncbi:aspartyl protease family protein [Erwinia sp. Eh17-17]|uniref:aspartyl protease family protein n=1 Tax=Erwinia sp. Eh17-17 TaxID=3080330 RepID=UPI003208F658
MKLSAIVFSAVVTLIVAAPPAWSDRAPSPGSAPLLTVTVRPDALIIPVTIHGRVYHFLLDTGMATLVIDNPLAHELTRKASPEQISPLYQQILSAGLRTAGGALDQKDLQVWQPLAIAIGDVVLPATTPWLGADLSALTQATGVTIDGIVGRDIFRQFTWQVDNQTHQLTVWPQVPGALDYPYCEPYLDGNDAGPRLTLDYHHRPVTMQVNTGVDYSYISAEMINVSREQPESAVLTSVDQPVLGIGGEEVSDGYSLSGLSFNQIPLGKLLARESKHGAFGLGMNFLARFDRYLFIPGEMQFCYSEQHFTRDEPAPLRLLAVRYYAKHVELFSNPPAALLPFGLQNGDALLEVNGSQVQPEEIHRIRSALADTPAGQLTLKIERRGKIKTLHI